MYSCVISIIIPDLKNAYEEEEGAVAIPTLHNSVIRGGVYLYRSIWENKGNCFGHCLRTCEIKKK
jgi:hypothetical protein